MAIKNSNKCQDIIRHYNLWVSFKPVGIIVVRCFSMLWLMMLFPDCLWLVCLLCYCPLVTDLPPPPDLRCHRKCGTNVNNYFFKCFQTPLPSIANNNLCIHIASPSCFIHIHSYWRYEWGGNLCCCYHLEPFCEFACWSAARKINIGCPIFIWHLTLCLIASDNPWQLVKPAHLILNTEQCFMHGLFMLKNLLCLFFLGQILWGFFFVFFFQNSRL